MNDVYKKLGLSDLLDQDISSYEYFYSLSPQIRKDLENEDVANFDELKQVANRLKSIYSKGGGINE